MNPLRWFRWDRGYGWGSWHIYHYTSELGRDISYCGRVPAGHAEESDASLPDGKTCESCLRSKASRDAKA